MAFNKIVVGLVVAAAAAAGADAHVCRPGSSSIVSSLPLTTSSAIVEATSAAVSTTASSATSIALSPTSEESTSTSATSSIAAAESTSASTTSITISTVEEPASSTLITATSTTSVSAASCPTQDLICGISGSVTPKPGLRFTTFPGTGVEDCKAGCAAATDCALFLLQKGSKTCVMIKIGSGPAGFVRSETGAYIGYDRGCFIC